MSPDQRRAMSERRAEDRISFVLISGLIVLGFAAPAYLIMDAWG